MLPFGDILKLHFGARDPSDDVGIDSPAYEPAYATPDLERIRHPDPSRIQFTWVGHSTFLIQINGLNILTDPFWSERASPVSFAGPKRIAHPGVRFEDLPAIDIVLISHTHYDHLDRPTIRRLGNAPHYIVPTGVAKFGSLGKRSAIPPSSLGGTVKLTAVSASRASRPSTGPSAISSARAAPAGAATSSKRRAALFILQATPATIPSISKKSARGSSKSP